jgi:hypothetical protein
MSDQDNFGKTAKALARGPLGIIALFIALVYAMAGLVFILAKDVNPGERTPLIYFLVIFPCFVLGVFAWLVAKHHEKLYAPGILLTKLTF